MVYTICGKRCTVKATKKKLTVKVKAEHKSSEEVCKAKVFMNGRSQAVRLPAAFRFSKPEVFVRRDPQSGGIILSERPQPETKSWEEIFSILDTAGGAEDLLSDRDRRPPQEREWM
jgi:antitoxin VapB